MVVKRIVLPPMWALRGAHVWGRYSNRQLAGVRWAVNGQQTSGVSLYAWKGRALLSATKDKRMMLCPGGFWIHIQKEKFQVFSFRAGIEKGGNSYRYLTLPKNLKSWHFFKSCSNEFNWPFSTNIYCVFYVHVMLMPMLTYCGCLVGSVL